MSAPRVHSPLDGFATNTKLQKQHAVNFIIDHDPAGRFEFAPIQSELAQSLLNRNGQAHLADVRRIRGNDRQTQRENRGNE